MTNSFFSHPSKKVRLKSEFSNTRRTNTGNRQGKRWDSCEWISLASWSIVWRSNLNNARFISLFYNPQLRRRSCTEGKIKKLLHVTVHFRSVWAQQKINYRWEMTLMWSEFLRSLNLVRRRRQGTNPPHRVERQSQPWPCVPKQARQERNRGTVPTQNLIVAINEWDSV